MIFLLKLTENYLPNILMKKMQMQKLESLQGGGCKKHLRRYHRAMIKRDQEKALKEILNYADCMGVE
jgi:hypothetical protein